jgi:hypothetical protein
MKFDTREDEMPKVTLFFTILVLIFTTLCADYDMAQTDDDNTLTDSDSVVMLDDDVPFDEDTVNDSDTSEPNYDDYNFPDVPENTDHDSIKTERITADGCSSLFVQ